MFLTTLFAVCLVASPVHPVHETVAEVEWNTTSKRLEVALRLDALDEQWLKQRLAADQSLKQWATEYLRRKFRIQDKPGAGHQDPSSYHWVGREQRGAHVWWFFEIEPRDHQEPTWIEQRMLFEREPNYTHRFLILDEDSRRSYTVTPQRPKATLNQVKNEPNSDPVDR